MVRLLSQCLAEFRDCLFEPVKARQHDSEVISGIRRARTERDGDPALRFRFFEPIQANENIAEIKLRIGMVRVQGDRPAVVRCRFVQTLQCFENDAEVIVKFGDRGVAIDGALDQFQRQFVAAGLMGDDTEIVQRPRMTGGNSEDLPISILGRRKLTGPMIGESLREHGVDFRQGGRRCAGTRGTTAPSTLRGSAFFPVHGGVG